MPGPRSAERFKKKEELRKMGEMSSMDQAQLDGLWQMENRYFNQFENVSLPLGGFNKYDLDELFLLCKRYCVNNSKTSGIKIADVGCWTGMSTLLLAYLASIYDGQVKAVDWFQGSPKTNLNFAGNYFNIRRIYDENLKQFPEFEKRIETFPFKSEEAVKKFDDGYFDIVFLDADHRYPYIKQDIEMWLPKLKHGGMICGHDCEMTFDKGINTLYDVYNDEDIAQVIHVGVCRAVTELGGAKTREYNPNSPTDWMKSGIWFCLKK